MNIKQVKSSCIAAVGNESGVLEVHFHNGGCYRYDGVPAQLIVEMMEAESQGAFYNAHIRDEYTCFKKLNKKEIIN